MQASRRRHTVAGLLGEGRGAKGGLASEGSHLSAAIVAFAHWESLIICGRRGWNFLQSHFTFTFLISPPPAHCRCEL